MKITALEQRRGEAGFTLVELAIVMIIIGLLIGGILKGQELIANAQTTATIAQMKGIDGALSTFRDKYSALPGDLRNPSQRLRGCTGNCANSGGASRGNGRIDRPTTLGTAPRPTDEGALAFLHMAAADLISGVDIDANDNPPAFGAALPEAKIGGGFWLGYSTSGQAVGLGAGSMRAGHYLVFNGLVQNAGGTNGGMTASQAAQVDRKLDDGDPQGGSAWAVGTGCVQSGEYNEDNDSSRCSVYSRVQA